MNYRFTLTLMTVLAFCGFSTLQAQSFSVSPSNTMTQTVYENGNVDMTIYFDNLTQDTLSLEWATSANTLNSGWQATLCDYGACYFGVPSGKVMDPVPPGDKGFLKLSLTVDSIVGAGSVSFRVWEEGVSSTEEIVTFNVDVLTGVNDIELAKLVEMFPNPAGSQLNFRIPQKLSGSELTLLDLRGAVISQQVLAAGQTEIDVTALPQGSYFARLVTKDGIVNKRFLKID